jgi:predicted Zn-dependent protease
MNNEFFWMESKPSGSVSLKTVLLHEIGHVLGLFHSELTDSVMYEYIFTNQIKRIHEVDKQDLRKIYSMLCQKSNRLKKMRLNLYTKKTK